MNNIYGKITELTKKYEKEVISIRRDIHMHPELSFKEYRTSGLVALKLQEFGIAVEKQIGKTGVVGILKCKNPGKVLAIRAEMDALPIDEVNDLPFKSINKGIMHACGHDCHTANLLGVAMILSELKNELSGTIKFIFQPAEENGGGAREMINDGVLQKPDVQAVLGVHFSAVPLGQVSFGYGNITANSDKFKLIIKGKKAHTFMPEQGVDAIIIASNIIMSLQSILSRKINPSEVATFSLGQIKGGVAANIVPDCVEIIGMMRCISDDARETIKFNIKKISKSIAEGMGGECDFVFKEGYPSVLNDMNVTNTCKDVAINKLQVLKNNIIYSKSNIKMVDKPMLVADDFGFYSHKVPSSLFFIGSGEFAPAHSPKFMVNEDVFRMSMDLLASSAVKIILE